MTYSPPTVIERCKTSQGELQLQQRGEDFEIISNGTFLMSTEDDVSERQLVRVALQAVPSPKHVLIGGLGVGFSLAEALNHHQVEHVKVIEIQQKIIDWQRDYFSSYTGNILDDPRAEVVCTDLIHWMTETDSKFDAICLDIDNGPDWLVSEQNRPLYSDMGLNSLRRLLSPNGVLTFWSATQSSHFLSYLRRKFSSVQEYRVKSGLRGTYFIYLSQKVS